MPSGEGILWRWDGRCMVPMHGHASKASVKYKVGSTYRLDEVERSTQSHDHYFACLKAVWENLPENLPYKWNNIDDMRRWALIQVGCCDDVKIECGSEGDRPVPTIRRLLKALRGIGKFAMTEIDDNDNITLHIARSQSLAEMGKKDFEDSKDKVLRLLGEIIGVSPEQLLEEGREATRVFQGR